MKTVVTRPTMAAGFLLCRQGCLKQLKSLLKPGTVVYTTVRHVARSGMSRSLDLYIIRNNVPLCISGYVAGVLDCRFHKKGGIIVGGCGMDMGFHIVYNLGRTLFPNGYKLKSGEYGRNGDTSGYETDGGYGLRHRRL